jgi:hypothetical protein
MNAMKQVLGESYFMMAVFRSEEFNLERDDLNTWAATGLEASLVN